MMQFSYKAEPLGGPAPPSLPVTSTVRWRPIVPVTIIGPFGRRRLFSRALLDPGADDTIFPMAVASLLAVNFHQHRGHGISWHGQSYPLRFADVELELSDRVQVWRWPAVVGFSTASIRYPLLGLAGCLNFFDANYRGQDRLVEIKTNQSFPGIVL